MKQGEQLRIHIDAMKKHLFPAHADYQERCDKFSQDVLTSVARRTTGTQVKPDDVDVLRPSRRSWEARRLARSRRRRETVQEIDIEDKENVCSSKHFFPADGSRRRKRRRDVLPSSVEFNSVTCCRVRSDPARLSSQFYKFFASLPLADGQQSRVDNAGACTTLTRSVDSHGVRRPVVPDTVGEVRSATAAARDDDTSIWSAISVTDERRPRSAAADSVRGSPELSRICGSSDEQQRELREQTSSGDLTGAFHSTFSYPLHSTLLTAAVADSDVSSVLQTVAEADVADLEQTALDDAALIGSKTVSTPSDVEQDFDDAEQKANAKLNGFEFDNAATGITVPSKGNGPNTMPVMSRLSCYTEAGCRWGGRTLSYFPPLFKTVDAWTLSAAAAAVASVNVPVDQQATDDVDNLSFECDNEDSQVRGVDTSLEAVRGSPCDDSREPTMSPVPASAVIDVGCRRCRPSVTAASGSAHYRRQRHCIDASSTSKSGGRGTRRMAREIGRCDLRHTFNGSRLEQDVSYKSSTVRELFGVHPSRGWRTVDCRSTRVDHRPRQRRPRCSRCRCGVEERNSSNLRTGRSLRGVQHCLAPPGESESKPSVKRSERYVYFDPVRKRSLVNRLKQFSGCFSDNGCGRRMQTLANV